MTEGKFASDSWKFVCLNQTTPKNKSIFYLQKYNYTIFYVTLNYKNFNSMNSVTPLDVNRKINALPDALLQEVDKYIDFLNFRNSTLSAELSEKEISLIEKGKSDIEQNRLIPHKEAKERIKNYIKNKSL